MTPDQALTALKEELIEKMKIGNGYSVEPSVKYGAFSYDQIDPGYTTLCFADYGLDPEEHLGRDGHWWLNIMVYGYAPYHGLSDTEQIRKLALNFLHFMVNHYTYSDQTELTSNIEILPGDNNRPASMFILEIRVLVEYDHTTLNT